MQESKPGFSVVIPAFNAASFIKKAIDSCLLQTVLPLEIIIVDDCSTDNTREIIQEVGSPLVRYIANTVNSGPSYSRNQGIRLALGDWILFLDADDEFHCRKIEVIEKLIEKYDATRVIGHAALVGTSISTLNELSPPAELTVSQISYWSLLIKNRIFTPALAVAKSNALYFDEEMSFAEDHDFIVRSAQAFGLWYLDFPLSKIDRKPLTPGGLSSDRYRMRRGELRMYWGFCKRNNLIIVYPLFVFISLSKHFFSVIRKRFGFF